MTPTRRAITLSFAAMGIAAFGAVCVAGYRPRGVTDRSLATEWLKKALAALDDQTLNSTARLAAYSDGLTETGTLLRRTLRSNPADTFSIERLAMVRWEASVLSGAPDIDSVLSLVSIAASRAPRVPAIQADLGSLLYKMGLPGEAALFMKRSMDLSPAMTNHVVTLMQSAGIEPEEILATLAQSADVLIALREGYVQSGRTSEWLTNAEDLLPSFPRQLLPSYTNACRSAKEPDRLLAHADALGVLPDPAGEAERQFAIGWAQVDRGAPAPAASAARRGRSLSDGNPRMLERAGHLALAAGDAAEAELAFRLALGAFARGEGRGSDRARCYRERGQALERLGRAEEAFDQYRRAIEILPDDPWLRDRFAAWSTGAVAGDTE